VEKTKGRKTRDKILEAGVAVWPDVTARSISRQIGMTHPAILYHFPNGSLRESVVSYALKNRCSRVIAHLIVTGDKSVSDLSSQERQQHLSAI
jgi:AcrR family transcriptional regulator